MRKWPFIKIVLSTLVLFSCKGEAHGHHHHHDHDHDHEHDEADGFHWTAEKTQYANVKVAVAGPGTIQNIVQTSGKVAAHPDQLAYVIPRIEGIVWEIRKNIGEEVQKNEVLALIESAEISDAKANYIAASKLYAIQQKLLKQEASLRGISPYQDYLQAELATEEAATRLDLAVQKLYALGFSEQDLPKIAGENPGARRLYELKAPFKGKITQRNLTLGECVDHTTRSFTIANFDKIWVEMHIPQTDVHYLKEGLPVQMMGQDGKNSTAAICQFNPTICEETRMAKAIAIVDNTPQKWVPGEFISVGIQANATYVPLVVAREALLTMKGESYVFVEEEEGSFVPRPVVTGKTDEQYVEIISGLENGEVYAACNAFCIKADYEKEEVEHHH